MNLLKRHAFIAAGICLYVANAFYPLNGIAESLAANTKESHPAIAVNQTGSDFGPNTLEYFMMDEASAKQLPLDKATDSSLDDTAFGPIQLPGITSPAADTESYHVERPNGETYTIKVERESVSGFASVYINNQEVMKFRSGYEVLDAYDRAQLVAQRLYSYLNDSLDVTSPKAPSIAPALEDGHYVLKMGEEVLAGVDREAAMANGNSEKAQAIVWTNKIRGALGVQPYREPLSAVVANIISSPGMSKKYKMPLSTAYFKSTGKHQSGLASWYGPGFHGRRSSDGSRFDMNQMTAAHRNLPFGTVVKVKNNRNGKQCLVQITDRGPYAHNRIIDLSKAAAGAIGMLSSGTANVTIEVLTPGKSQPVQPADTSLIGSTANADAGKN